MGWGRTNNLRGDSGDKKEGGAYKNVLQKLALPAIDIRKCRNNPAWRSFHRITPDRQLCAGGEIREFLLLKYLFVKSKVMGHLWVPFNASQYLFQMRIHAQEIVEGH